MEPQPFNSILFIIYAVIKTAVLKPFHYQNSDFHSGDAGLDECALLLFLPLKYLCLGSGKMLAQHHLLHHLALFHVLKYTL